MNGDLLARDARVCWHPLTQHRTEAPLLPVASARDSILTLTDGREVIDAISSWWACLHGHGRRELLDAMRAQAERLDHVLFAGATHEPAVALAEALVAVAPPGLSRVFFSDDGSTAVEVALKMTLQRWQQHGAPLRQVFVAFEGGYHGDTVGALSVSDPDPYFRAFGALAFAVRRVPLDAGALEAALAALGGRAAGVILEPLVQGAAGMRMHPPRLVQDVRALCDRFGVPLILDEVMTGFGRTGSLFAAVQCGVTPDLLCLAKGLTGGTMPLAATLATEAFFEAFLADGRDRAFLHGHTFTAHPVACAVAKASLELTLRDDVPARLDSIGARIESGLRDIAADRSRVRELRRCGGIVALELEARGGDAGYFSASAPRLRALALARGVLLRPLGKVVYSMPPASTTPEQCDRIAAVMTELACAP